MWVSDLFTCIFSSYPDSIHGDTLVTKIFNKSGFHHIKEAKLFFFIKWFILSLYDGLRFGIGVASQPAVNLLCSLNF